MLEGKCPKCGYRCYGWGLRFPRNQSCPKCGSALAIYEDGKLVAKGYSPFTADKYSLPGDKAKKDSVPEEQQ